MTAFSPPIQQAMVLAAGKGMRMRPLTDKRPKPLVEVGGRAMIDLVLDRLAAAGVERAVVNLYHLGEQIEEHLKDRGTPRICFSREETLLETGGGVRQALHHFGNDAFFVVNGDVVWLDGLEPALLRLAKAWDDQSMDALLLLHPTAHALGYEGLGDFLLDPLGRLKRRQERQIAPFIFAGLQILHPRLFEDTPDGAFSLNVLYDRAIENDRLKGLRHDGEWFHVGTTEALRQVEEELPFLGPTAHYR